MNTAADTNIKMRDILRLYADRRMAKILLLGFISGFPWLLIGSMLALWLKEEGVSRTGIGLFGILFSVYAVNALWAPLVDKIRIPLLHRLFGKRRAWILLMQLVIACALFGMFLLPGAAEYRWWVALFAFMIALASATQDVAIDATRIEMLASVEAHKIGAGSAMATSGWWLGFGGGKVIALPLVEQLQNMGIANAWQAGYLAMIVIVVLSMIAVVVFLRPTEEKEEKEKKEAAEIAETATTATKDNEPEVIEIVTKPWRLYTEPLRDFITRYTLKPALLLLCFIIFFKIGEAFLGRMSVVFYKEIGFSKSDIALLSGGLGTITVCLFAILGSFFNARYGLLKGIILGGVAMAMTNLLFVLLAYYPEKWLFTIAVVADQFTTSVSTVAFVAFLSQLCDRRHTATHYAALASLGNLSRTVFAASSGVVVDSLQEYTGATADSGLADVWAIFFCLTVLMVLPSLFILRSVYPRIAPIMQGTTTKIL